MGSKSRRLLNQSTHSSVANSTATNDRHGPRRDAWEPALQRLSFHLRCRRRFKRLVCCGARIVPGEARAPRAGGAARSRLRDHASEADAQAEARGVSVRVRAVLLLARQRRPRLMRALPTLVEDLLDVVGRPYDGVD